MPSIQPSAATAPLQIIQNLYVNAGCPATSGSFGVEEHFAALLKEAAALEQVPVLGRDVDIPVGSLVRFRGMVVDMHDPEFYFGSLKYKDGTGATTKYGGIGVMRSEEEPVDSKVWERRPLRCIPVPGESSWASPLTGSVPATVFVYDDQGQDIMLHQVLTCVGVHMLEPSQAEESLEGEDAPARSGEDPTPALQVHAILLGPQAAPAPAPAQQQQQQQQQQAHEQELMASPAAVQRCRGAALGVLRRALGGDALGAEYLLLSLLSQVTARGSGQPPTGPAPMNLILPPESPLTASASQPAAAPPAGPPPATAASTANTAAGAASAGPNTSSSSSSSSAPPLPASRYGAALHAALAALTPICSYLPLSVQQCNSGSWAPRRDYDTNRLTRSPLQLACGTVLLVDETPLGEGRLSETGIASFSTLSTLVQQQALLYDFQFYKSPVPCSVAPVVLSKGRSVLHEALPIKLHLRPTAGALPTAEQVAATISLLGAPALSDVRAYMAAAKQLPYELSEAMVKQLQDEFVAARKGDRTFSPEKFHARLTVARLAAISFGERELRDERWRYVLGLEAELEGRSAK